MSDSVDTENLESETQVDEEDNKAQKTSTLSAEEQRAIKRRDAALKKARDLETKAAEYERRLAEREAAEQELQAEAERKNGEWSKLTERKDKQIEKLNSRLQEMEAAEAKRVQSKRRDAYVSAIAEATGIKNMARLRGLLREAADAFDVDTSPEEVTDDLVSEGIEAMKRLDSDTFAPKPSKQTPVPGAGVKTDAPEKIDWFQVAAAGGIDAYKRKLREQG